MPKTSQVPENTSPVTTDFVVGETAVGPSTSRFKLSNLITLFAANFGSGTVSSKALTNPYKFYVYRNSAQNSGNNAFAVVNFDTKFFDTGSNVDIVTNVGRFTAPVAGFYWFGGSVATAATTTIWLVSLFKNGSEILRGTKFQGPSSSGADANVMGILQLAAGDYIEVSSFGSSAVALEVASSGVRTYFQGFLVSAT